MNRNRGAGKQSAPSRGVWGHAPQKISKIQGVSGAFWYDFGTYELRHQLTSAHTRATKLL